MSKGARARGATCRFATLLKGILLAAALVLALGFGAAAQDDAPILSIIRSDSQTFPRVTAYVAATDGNGMPLGAVQAGGLTRDMLVVLEGTFGAPAEINAVEQYEFQDLRLVMVLDISTSEASLETIKQAAAAFIDELETRDKVALVALYNDVRILQRDFSNNKTELQATIAALDVEGDRTALNEAIFEGVNIAATAPDSRRAVIVITNARNNIGDFPAATAINAAQEYAVPVYIINFEGDADIRPDPIKDMLGTTGGKTFIISNAEKIGESLQAVEKLIRTGYKITFRSRLEADNREYGWALGVIYRGSRAAAEGRLVTVPGRIKIVPNVTDGQQVGSIVSLDAEVTAPATVEVVEYMLDGRLLARFEPRGVAKPAYRFDWDSTTESSGVHKLVIKAVDDAGNEGAAEIALKVVPPLRVAARVLRDGTRVTQFQAEDAVTLVAEVNAIEDVERVDFLLNGELLGSAQEAVNGVYTLPLAGDPNRSGAYILTARARDVRKQEGEDSVVVQIIAVVKTVTPVTSPITAAAVVDVASPLTRTIAPRRLLSALIILIATATFVLLALIFIWLQRTRYQEIMPLKVSNIGNISSTYALQAVDPMSALQFDFMLNGMVLPEWTIVEEISVEEVAAEPTESATETLPATPAVQGSGGGAEKTTPAQTSAIAKLRGSVDTAQWQANKEKGEAALQRVGQVGKVSSSIAALLPTPLRAPFLGLARILRLPGTKVTKVTTFTKGKVSGIQAVSASTAKLRAPAKSGKGARTAAPPTAHREPASAKVPSERVTAVRSPRQTPSPKSADSRAPQSVRKVMNGWYQTALLEPGESLTLDLVIAPVKRLRRAQKYIFTIASKAIEHEEDHVKISGNIEIKGISWIRYYLVPALLLAAMTLTLIVAVWFLFVINGIDLPYQL